MESRTRSLAKTFTWRIVAYVITLLAVMMYNHNFKEAAVVSFWANLIKMFFYYIHERAWTNIRFGQYQPEYEI